MTHRHFCGVGENQIGIIGGQVCQWPRGHEISVSIHSEIPAIGYARQLELTRKAWDAWSNVAGVRYRLLDRGQPANVEIFAKSLDSAGGVLAQATLPCGAGPTSKHWQQYDNGETWALKTAEQAAIDYLTVCIHETGHSLGWGHAPDQACIMYAAYTGPKSTLCGWEVAQATQRYGEPGDVPPQPPGPLPPPDWCAQFLDCMTSFASFYRARRLRQSRNCDCR